MPTAYDRDTVYRGLAALAVARGNSRKAAGILARHGISVDQSTLHRWKLAHEIERLEEEVGHQFSSKQEAQIAAVATGFPDDQGLPDVGRALDHLQAESVAALDQEVGQVERHIGGKLTSREVARIVDELPSDGGLSGLAEKYAAEFSKRREVGGDTRQREARETWLNEVANDHRAAIELEAQDNAPKQAETTADEAKPATEQPPVNPKEDREARMAEAANQAIDG